MKKYLAIALCLVCAFFSSCVGKEQKAAIEYLKNSMDSPSSFKVVKVDVSQHECKVEYDTLYHVKKVVYEESFGYRISLESIEVDSIKIFRVEYPAYTDYEIEYDAANLFGAIVRDFDDVYVCNGKTFFASEYYGVFRENKSFDHQETYKKIYEDTMFASLSLENGSWADRYELGIGLVIEPITIE